MTRRIGWYIHHHGRGHLTRMLAIAAHLDVAVDCYSSLARPAGLPAHCTWTELPRDDEPRPGASADATVGGLLHWAPLGHIGHRRRLTTIAAELDARPVDAFVVDVSAEVALFVRLLGVRTVVVTQPGDRTDEAHRLAYAAADRVIAPWPGELYRPPHLARLDGRVDYVGGISRFAGAVSAGAEPHRAPDAGSDRTVVVLGGAGGGEVSADDLDRASAATGRPWRGIGTAGASWIDDPFAALTAASVVVSFCGQNAIADIAAAGVPAIVIPQERPFGEQRATATVLARHGLATGLDAWPRPDEWSALLERAEATPPQWERWHVRGAAARAAASITATAQAVTATAEAAS